MSRDDPTTLADTPLQPGAVDLMAGLATTRAIRRYRDEPIPERDLRDILFAATPRSTDTDTWRTYVSQSKHLTKYITLQAWQ